MRASLTKCFLFRTTVLLGISSLGLSSCEKVGQEAGPHAVNSSAVAARSTSESAANDYFVSLVSTLARVVNTNAQAKQVLMELAMKQFDGDYDVAYNTLLAANVDGATFAELLKQEGLQTDPLAAGLTQEEANRIIVAIPVNIENWKSTPVVKATYIPVGVPDSRLESLPAYDGFGKPTWVSPDLQPVQEFDAVTEISTEEQQSTPYIVASLGERLDKSGAVREEFTEFYQKKLALQRQEMAQTAARGGGRTEYLRGIKCDRLGQYEPAVRGEPEFRLYAATSYNNSFSSGAPVVMPYKIQNGTLFTGRRRNFDYGFDPNVLLFTWTSNFSDFYTVHWLEEDGGVTAKLTLDASFSKGGIKLGGSTTLDFSRWENDDDVGELPVHIADANWRYYTFSYYGPNPLFLTTMESR